MALQSSAKALRLVLHLEGETEAILSAHSPFLQQGCGRLIHMKDSGKGKTHEREGGKVGDIALPKPNHLL